MEEQKVSYDTAMLAKEKGFPQLSPLHVYSERLAHSFEDYHTGKEIKMDPLPPRILSRREGDTERFHCVAPTQSLLQKWLREVHNIHVAPLPSYNKFGQYTCEVVFKIGDIQDSIQLDYYDSYEEALEIGLQVALKLIKN